MAIQALPILQPFWHELERDKDNANPARFKLRALTSVEVVDAMATFENRTPTTKTFRVCAELGVIGVENMLDEKGSAVTWNPARLTQLNWLDVIELGARIYEVSINTEDDIKNSSSQSPS